MHHHQQLTDDEALPLLSRFKDEDCDYDEDEDYDDHQAQVSGGRDGSTPNFRDGFLV